MSNLTQILQRASSGNQDALDAVWPMVYDKLRELAHYRLAEFRPGQTLSTTALVHEAYLKLVDQGQADWKDRAHFFALASRAMRYILIDYARQQSRLKRGGRAKPIPIEEIQLSTKEPAELLVALDEALSMLSRKNERLGRLVEYRYFGGLKYEEIAEVEGLSMSTVKRDWRLARAKLFQIMKTSDE